MIFKLVGTLKIGRCQIISLHQKPTMGPGAADADHYLEKSWIFWIFHLPCRTRQVGTCWFHLSNFYPSGNLIAKCLKRSWKREMHTNKLDNASPAPGRISEMSHTLWLCKFGLCLSDNVRFYPLLITGDKAQTCNGWCMSSTVKCTLTDISSSDISSSPYWYILLTKCWKNDNYTSKWEHQE